MCYVIVTGRSLLWALLSLVSFMAVLAAVITPKWIVGPPIINTTRNGSKLLDIPTVGIFNRCTRLSGTYGRMNCGNFNVHGFATDSSVFPGCWKASLFFLALGLTVMAISVFAAFLGCCVQSIFRKSIFNLTGVVQAFAGLLYVLGIILYLAGWGAERVQKICGPDADAFYLGDCSFGWAFYSAIIGIALTFVCAILSAQAEKSTASDKVQDKMNEGKTLICLA
ncbi:LHFPL tetraspan subfamily member 2a protein [Venturia canescens]|uniref:LHFPL tetraspan subfamily member 2a protein n=1 Tax=Venturia canescens TaxID=32260 RepID=UPI001C9D3C60|nr:LHFPL tetraspan subfamily member 2a protein [Venturia canescens]XP_043288762.1 LHFPL tetraspan subfamily member 2a protein [Venturia canescens]XP_043288763.1 LHFPL tetraspan subfamily member 2a protein [Venturia canescens]XP_043288764.1 LHFPL tetraspan subfamily member 2a protein [Venturia canescens]